MALEHVALELREVYEMVLPAVIECGEAALGLAAEELAFHPKLRVLASVLKRGANLEAAPPELQDDEQV